MAQINSWVKQPISISVNDLIDLTRGREIEDEANSRANTMFSERMAWLNIECAKEEEKYAQRRAKIKATLERKKREAETLAREQATIESNAKPMALSS